MVRGDAWAEVGAMGLALLAWAAPKRWAVAGPRASLIRARAEQACPKELDIAFSMDQRGAMAYSLCELASSKSRAPTWPTCFFAEQSKNQLEV